MMNKAEKRKLEIKVYSDAYCLIENYGDFQLKEMESWKDTKKEILEENETGKMCSLSVGEAGEMCSPVSADTCRDNLSFEQPKNGFSCCKLNTFRKAQNVSGITLF